MPSQLYRPVHAKLAFKYLHRPLHKALHPHRMSSWQDSFACGRAVQKGDYELLSCCHPQSDGLGSTGWQRRVWPHMQPPRNTALLTCCSSKALVGGMLSKLMDLFKKSFCRASFTFVRLLVRSYISTTNLSSTTMHPPVISCGDTLRTFSTGVIWGNTFFTPLAVFFHVLQKTKQYQTQLAHGT